MRSRRSRSLVWMERALVGFGAACLAWCGLAAIEAASWQQSARALLERSLRASAPAPAQALAVPAIRPGSPIGEIEIPRLHLSAVVIEGDDARALGLAVGHLPDTPLPWEPGNSALAAHRDTFFRPLEGVRGGDLIRLITPRGAIEYRVRETLVVEPEDVWVLDPTTTPTLTLITCYPFHYVGRAPHRFIVRAERTET